MNVVFHFSGAVAILATLLAITGRNAVHALLYLVVSLLALAVVFYTLGAPFVAALEVIIYAGAIIVLFIFVVMMLNLGPSSEHQERQWLQFGNWIGPMVLCGVLVGEVIYILVNHTGTAAGIRVVEPKAVGLALFGPYLLGVELASMLLLAGLVGAYHIGRRIEPRESTDVAQASSPAGPGGVPPPVSGPGTDTVREPAAGTAALRFGSSKGGC